MTTGRRSGLLAPGGVYGFAVVLLAAAFLLAVPSFDRVSEAMAPLGLVPTGHLGESGSGPIGVEACSERDDPRCLLRQPGRLTGGFGYPVGVAASPFGEVYVTEALDQRIQRRDDRGRFSVLGADVDVIAAARPHSSQAQRDLCAPSAAEKCGPGRSGAAPGELDGPESVAVEPASGDIFVLEVTNDDYRVDKLTAGGGFLWRLGGHVNLTTGGDLCTAREVARAHVRCGPGEPSDGSRDEPGAFKFANQSGDLLAFDQRHRLLYVGDEHRVQVLDADGRRRYQIPLVSISTEPHSSVVALGLTPSGGLDLVYRVGRVENYLPSEQADVIHELGADGRQEGELTVSAAYPGARVSIDALAVGPAGQVVVMGVEIGAPTSRRFALVYWPRRRETVEIAPPIDNDGIAFDSSGKLYVATAVDSRVQLYDPAVVSDALSAPLACASGPIAQTEAQGSCPRVVANVKESVG